MQISSQKKSDAIATLEMAIEAAKNSNSDGERAVMAAASGLRLLGALKRLMPELRKMRDDGIISKEQFSDVERGIAAAEGRDAYAAPASPQPTRSTNILWMGQPDSGTFQRWGD
jgi:hypothetical protein